MKRIILGLGIALFTFTIGVITFFLWPHNELSSSSARAITSEIPSELSAKFPQEIDLRWAYINRDIKWETDLDEVSRERGGRIDYGSGYILVFYPDGRFASISCTIYKFFNPHKLNKLMIIPNEGFSINKGTWKQNSDGTITATSRCTASNKRIGASGRENEEIIEHFGIRKTADYRLAGELELNGRIFIPSPDIDSVIEILSFPDKHI